MSLAQIGCVLSHNAVLREMIDKNYNNVLILEDDIVPVEGVANTLKMAISELPEKWELLY